MRRIFGGSSITSSSTSNSLASDALPSPTSTSHDRTSPPATPTQELAPGLDPQTEPRKGWFGGLGGGLARSTSASSITTRNTPSPTGASLSNAPAGSSRLAESVNLEAEDDFDFGNLPFGQARSPPPMSPPQIGRRRDSARSSMSGGFGAVQSRPFSPEGVLAEAATVTKDSLLIELLSGAAVLEAKDFEVLSWEDMQEAKKEHALLSTRIASLTRSVALETRLRDSAAKLVRLSAPAGAVTTSNPASPARPRVTREQAEAQLATAQGKLDALQADLYKVGSRESDLRTKLLRHTAAVLAVSLRQKEQEEQGLPPSATNNTLSPALAASQRRDTPSPTGSNRFDGAHFFAGNREAIVPTPRSRTISANGAGSPYASPQPNTGAFGANSVQLQHDLAERDARVKELEGQAGALERQLEEVKQRAEEDVRAMREELDRAREAVREEQDRARREVSSAQAEVEELKEELHAAREDVEHAQRNVEDARHEADEARREVEEVGREVEEARREAEDARREADEHRSQATLARSGVSTDSSRDIDTARQDQDAARKLRDMGMELAEAEHKLSEAEERVAELEEELQRTEEEMKDERRTWEEKVREAEAAGSVAPVAATTRSVDADSEDGVEDVRRRVGQLEAERKSVVQAIGDVLRRHRTRPTLGVVLRDSPSFDDTTERDDLPAYLASTLDAHFDKAASHVSSLTADLSSAQGDADARADLEDELSHAHERIQALEGDVASLQAERDSLETELDLLRSQAHDQEARLSSLPQLEADLAAAQSAASRAQEELASMQVRLAELDGQVGAHGKATAQLQELWRAIPPLEGRARANSQSDDLSVLRSAFDPAAGSSPPLPARKPIGALLKSAIGVGGDDNSEASDDYSVEALVERVKTLLAEDEKLVNKLVAFEGEKGDVDSQKKKITELEERIEVSANQEVSMLERLNDLTESLEQTRSDKRKLEVQLRTLEADKAQLEEQLAAAQQSAVPAASSAPVAADEGELQELRDQIADLEEELADAQRREQKTRSQLLDELSGVQSELSQAKTKLRQAERKLGSKA
ncbi:hypothetical protein JCM10449v2_005799 [Rhodotorula kratochvilovae]